MGYRIGLVSWCLLIGSRTRVPRAAETLSAVAREEEILTWCEQVMNGRKIEVLLQCRRDEVEREWVGVGPGMRR